MSIINPINPITKINPCSTKHTTILQVSKSKNIPLLLETESNPNHVNFYTIQHEHKKILTLPDDKPHYLSKPPQNPLSRIINNYPNTTGAYNSQTSIINSINLFTNSPCTPVSNTSSCQPEAKTRSITPTFIMPLKSLDLDNVVNMTIDNNNTNANTISTNDSFQMKKPHLRGLSDHSNCMIDKSNKDIGQAKAQNDQHNGILLRNKENIDPSNHNTHTRRAHRRLESVNMSLGDDLSSLCTSVDHKSAILQEKLVTDVMKVNINDQVNICCITDNNSNTSSTRPPRSSNSLQSRSKKIRGLFSNSLMMKGTHNHKDNDELLKDFKSKEALFDKEIKKDDLTIEFVDSNHETWDSNTGIGQKSTKGKNSKIPELDIIEPSNQMNRAVPHNAPDSTSLINDMIKKSTLVSYEVFKKLKQAQNRKTPRGLSPSSIEATNYTNTLQLLQNPQGKKQYTKRVLDRQEMLLPFRKRSYDSKENLQELSLNYPIVYGGYAANLGGHAAQANLSGNNHTSLAQNTDSKEIIITTLPSEICKSYESKGGSVSVDKELRNPHLISLELDENHTYFQANSSMVIMPKITKKRYHNHSFQQNNQSISHTEPSDIHSSSHNLSKPPINKSNPMFPSLFNNMSNNIISAASAGNCVNGINNNATRIKTLPTSDIQNDDIINEINIGKNIKEMITKRQIPTIKSTEIPKKHKIDNNNNNNNNSNAQDNIGIQQQAKWLSRKSPEKKYKMRDKILFAMMESKLDGWDTDD